MINKTNIVSKSDLIGVVGGSLCAIHCLATPFLFMAKAGLSDVHASLPWWWATFDILFLAVSFFAVYWSTKHTSKQWVKYVFWFLWVLLAFIVVNEKWELVHLSEESIYFPTLGLIVLHFYNQRYCHCNDDSCCVDH